MIKKTINRIKEVNKQITITSAIVSLSAKISCADGGDLFLKHKVFSEIFKSTRKEKKNIDKIFKLASQELKGYDSYAKILYKKFKKFPEVLEELLMAFLKISKANGTVADSSLEVLKIVAKTFKISEKDFVRICNINNVYDMSNPYIILGVSVDISKEDLKSHYKKLAMKYHPDHLISCGMPAEMIGLLENKMAEVNKAYNNIKEENK